MNIGFKHRSDGEIEAWAHGNRLLFFCFYGGFQSMAELRCTPRECRLLAILIAVNDAQPDERSLVGIFANNADEDRGFLGQKWGVLLTERKNRRFLKKDGYRHQENA